MRRYIADAHRYWVNGEGTQAGRVIYSNLQPGERPAWATGILRVVLDMVPPIPEAEAVVATASARATWPQARECFHRVRKTTLQTTDRLPLNCLLLAENVAKVIFNATGLPAPFDEDAGWSVVGCAHTIAEVLDDPALTAKIWSAIAQLPQTDLGSNTL